MRKAKRVAAVIDAVASIALGTVDALSRAEIIAPFVGSAYLPIVYLAGFAGALWLLNSAHREETEEATAKRASIRLSVTVGGAMRFLAANVGEREALGVEVSPLDLDGYPWRGSFRRIGNLIPSEEQELHMTIEDAGPPCDSCLAIGRPGRDSYWELQQTFRGLAEHWLHAEPRATWPEETRAWRASHVPNRGLEGLISFPLAVTWSDTFRRYRADYRADFVMRTGNPELRCEFGREVVLGAAHPLAASSLRDRIHWGG